MSKLFITELKAPSIHQGKNAACFDEPGLDQTPVTISGTSTQSAAFAADTKFVRVHTDVICSIRFGLNPTATTANKRLMANQTESFHVLPGQKVAVITNT